MSPAVNNLSIEVYNVPGPNFVAPSVTASTSDMMA